MFWTPELAVGERQRAYDCKVESLVLDVQRQNGLPCEPRKIYLTNSLDLTGTMMALVEGFQLALFCELDGIAPPPLPSGLLPLLVERVPEDRLSAVLDGLRAAAQRLHEEDDTPTMQVARFFAQLRS